MNDAVSTYTARTRHGELRLELSQEWIEIEAHVATELDPAWEHVDAQGHRHTNLDGLTRVVTGVYWCDQCGDEHEESEWRCLLCRDVVEPRYVAVNKPAATLPGLMHGTASLVGQNFSRLYVLRPDELKALRAAFFSDGLDDWVTSLLLRDPDEVQLYSGSR